MLRCASLLLLVLLITAPASVAQPMSITASAAVTWISGGAQTAAPPPPETESVARPGPDDVSMGDVRHPALVVVWRGQPGWMFEDGTPDSVNTMSFSSASEFSRPSLTPVSTLSVKQGAVRLEIAYRYETRELRLNGMPVHLPGGHDVVLVDHVDDEPVVVDTLRIGGSERERVEALLARSDRVLDFLRCDLALPEDTFGHERFRRGMQRVFDERCEMMIGRRP